MKAAPLTRNWILVLLVVLLLVAPWVVRRGGEFAGSDDRASNAIEELKPGYKPWVRPLWTPPGGSVESLLFALQAAAGAGFIGYYLGLKRGRREAVEEKKPCT